MDPVSAPFPATLTIDYPDRELDRFTTFFRPLMLIPIAILLAFITGGTLRAGSTNFGISAGGVVFPATVLMLVFRQKYPRWWFDWNLAVTRFSTRVSAYATLLCDEYPSTDQDQAVHIEVPYPDARELNRWLPLIKWFLVLPHYIVLAFLCIAAVFSVIFAWFAILFTGRYPRELFTFVVGVFRWSLRVGVYAFLLTTDRYPPFSLSP